MHQNTEVHKNRRRSVYDTSEPENICFNQAWPEPAGISGSAGKAGFYCRHPASGVA